MSRPISQGKREEWVEKFRQQKESGLSVRSWCAKNQLTGQAFYYWRIKLFPKAAPSRSCFIELSEPKEVGIAIECAGCRIHLEKDFDASTFKRCLAVLREMPC